MSAIMSGMQVDNELLKQVDEHIRPTLTYKDIPNPRLIVTFSAPTSAGKSTIAKQLEQRLRGVRLENDTVRALAAKWYPDSTPDERTALAHKYSEYFATHLAREIPNGLWIIDSSLDRHYNKVFEFAEQFGFAIFIIALDISEELQKKWIIAGGNRPFLSVTEYLDGMAQGRREQAAFLAQHKPDVTIQPPYDVEKLAQTIEQRIQQLKTQLHHHN
jgi:predicted kinase